MKPLVRAAVCLATLFLASGCYCCRQDYNPHTGMHYQCRQFGVSLFKKECCRKEGAGCDGACGHQRECETGACPGEIVEGPYMEGGHVPQTYYEPPYVREGAPVQPQPGPMQYQPTLQPTPAAPANETNWQGIPPKAPPATQTGYRHSVRLR
ncbi:MAG: hypothetical protein WED34_10715 [Planctomycetales bacterium]